MTPARPLLFAVRILVRDREEALDNPERSGRLCPLRSHNENGPPSGEP